jgi:C1A family cysteine protease
MAGNRSIEKAKKTGETSSRGTLRPHRIQWYGWLPDVPDRRDRVYAAPAPVIRALPGRVDLRPQCPPVYDQGSLGSCTANAIGGALEFQQHRQGKPSFTPSRLFIYYNERAMENTVDQDAGAMIRDGIKSVASLGAPPEAQDWPYVIANLRTRPPRKAYADALKYQALLYERVPRRLDQLQGCLAAGFPFVLGIAVYESFESQAVADTGTVPVPKLTEQNLGGHAILAVGYDNAQQRFLVRNSWGADWGMDGYFTLPYAYVLDENLADDFWTIKLVE